MSSIPTSISMLYMPSFEGPYVNPQLSREVRQQRENERLEKIKQAFFFLANENFTRKKRLGKKYTCLPPMNNNVCNLAAYILNHPLQMMRSAFFCCIPSFESYKRPLPQGPAQTLENTRQQFERNTCGVCCIAPAVIAATPFIPATALIATLLEIFSGIVITTTAGTNTYVFSGDTGVMRDSDGLVVQGGIRVESIQDIKIVFNEIAKFLKKQWQQARSDADRTKMQDIGQACQRICLKWKEIFSGVKTCGLRDDAVEDILSKFSLSLAHVLDEYESCTKDSPVMDASLSDKTA